MMRKGSIGNRKYHRIMLSFAFVIGFLLHLLLFSTGPMVTQIMEEMNLSHADFGFVFSAVMMGLLLFRIPWGLIGDRIGYLNVFRIALPILAASAILRGYSPGYFTLLVSQILLGLGSAAILPCLPLLIREWASNRDLGLSTGIYVSGFALGNFTALGLTPHFLTFMNWREVLLVHSGFATLVAGLWWGFARGAGSEKSEFKPEKFTVILKEKYVWILLLFMIASMGSYDTLAAWMPKVLEMKGSNKAFASLLSMGFFLAGPMVGFLSDRLWDKRRILAILGAVSCVSVIGINYVSFPFLPLSIFLAGFTITGVFTVALSAPAEHPHLFSSIGGVIGLISSLGNIGPIIMSVVFGLLIDITGTFYLSIIAIAVLSSVTLLLSSTVNK